MQKTGKDARIRAEAIAFQAVSKVNDVKRVNTGISQITFPKLTRISILSSYETTTIKKDITALMGVTFDIK